MFSCIISIILDSFDFYMLSMMQPIIVRRPNIIVSELVIEAPYL